MTFDDFYRLFPCTNRPEVGARLAWTDGRRVYTMTVVSHHDDHDLVHVVFDDQRHPVMWAWEDPECCVLDDTDVLAVL